ncbi:MAG: endonuclease III [Actinomycetaceae bacterium]|nr:endonuclease III [Actinomycetaceae bacterium]
MSKKVAAKLPPRPRSLAQRRAAANEICAQLTRIYPDSACGLTFSNPFELLVATVLSAQTTDARVNSVTPTLFEHFPTPEKLAQAQLSELENILRPLGFFRSKAKSCQGLSRLLCEEFDGEVPRTLEELVRLPGVGRKTANVVLGNVFDVPGITVDTHVGRLSRRWAWTRHDNPVKVEEDIARLLPPEEWTITCHRIIDHGRAICHARRPNCGACPLADLCPSYPLT